MTVMAETIPTKRIKRELRFPTSRTNSSILSGRSAVSTSMLNGSALPKYTKIRNRVTSQLRSAKKVHFHQLAENIHTPRDFWSQYHRLNPKHCKSPSSRQTSQLRRQISSTISSPPVLPEPKVSHTCHQNPILSSVVCSHEEVHKLLSTHKVNTASGPDGISSVMLRGTADAITPALTSLFNLSLMQCTIPDQWKLLNVTPIHKSGHHSDTSNYRPISLLSLISSA